MINFTFQLEGAEGATRSIKGAVNSSIANALQQLGDAVALDAKMNHVFRNRTGLLEKSIHCNKVRGTFLNNTLYVEVVANRPYASFVEERITYRSWAYLKPAYNRQLRLAPALFNNALRVALGR